MRVNSWYIFDEVEAAEKEKAVKMMRMETVKLNNEKKIIKGGTS